MKVKVKIDTEHTIQLMEGKPIAVKIPSGATVLELQIVPQSKDGDSLAKIIDVFFNGRSA